MSRTQEWQIKTLFHNNFSKLVITNLLNKFFLSTANDAICESAETSNPSGNDFRQPRKCQTTREMTFASCGNAKPFGKRLSPSAEMPNLSGNDFRQARKCQTTRETTFANRGNVKPFGKRLSPTAEMPNLLKNGLREAHKHQNL